MTRTTSRTALFLLAVAVMIVVGAGLRSWGSEDQLTPAAIVDASLGTDDRVEVWIDRCGSEPTLTGASIAGVRIVVEVTAKPGSAETCQDRVDVAIITDDILELEDATSGEVFVLRTVRPERANRPPGTRE